MTTIAWDGKTLAVDSLETKGDTVTSTNIRKLFLNIGPFKAVAFTGSSQDAKPILEWIKSGDKTQPKFEQLQERIRYEEKQKQSLRRKLATA